MGFAHTLHVPTGPVAEVSNQTLRNIYSDCRHKCICDLWDERRCRREVMSALKEAVRDPCTTMKKSMGLRTSRHQVTPGLCV